MMQCETECTNGENHEWDSSKQKISYNESQRDNGGIHFQDDDGTISNTHDILTKTYVCLVCKKTICETYQLFSVKEVQ